MKVTISADQLLYDSAVIPSGVSPRIHPWQKPLPPVLCKYYPPERFHILTDCTVRFSQREVFDDQYELAGDVQYEAATTHLPENTGDTAFDVIVIELKTPAAKPHTVEKK